VQSKQSSSAQFTVVVARRQADPRALTPNCGEYQQLGSWRSRPRRQAATGTFAIAGLSGSTFK
jgi:hypothetical protein